MALIAVGVLALAAPASAQSDFVRGDCNVDAGYDISDPIFFLGFLFSGGGPILCEDACDANDDGGLDIGDAVFSLGVLFSGNTMPAPDGVCGDDPTADTLGCADFAPCFVPVEDCANSIDDDGDGDIDCADADCTGDPACQVALSLAMDIQPIFDNNCAFCHDSVAPFAGLNLETNTFANIVNVASTQCTTVDFIEPGMPQQSWLFRKVLGTHTQPDLGCTGPGAGGQMPPGAFCCPSQQEIDLLEQWIIEGANP